MTTEEKIDETTQDDSGASLESDALTHENGQNGASTHVPEPVTGLQLGSRRFVYAAYFGFAIGVAFVIEKAVSLVWTRLAQWKPAFGEPHDEFLMPIAGVLGVATAIYYYRRDDAREYVEQVAEELAKVTWPSKREVTNSTTVVVIATAVATVFFALMDQFWRYLTNLVYGF